MSERSPGPWKFWPDRSLVADARESPVAEVYLDANAHLIAAAPEMLALLRTAVPSDEAKQEAWYEAAAALIARLGG